MLPLLRFYPEKQNPSDESEINLNKIRIKDRNLDVLTSEDLEAEVKQTLETLPGDLRASEGFRGNGLERLTIPFLAINMAAILLYSDRFPSSLFFPFLFLPPFLIFSCYKVNNRENVAVFEDDTCTC